MKNKIGLVIAILLLGYGIMRIGVGSVLIAQTLEIVNFPDLSEAALEIEQFIGEREGKQLIPFTATGYSAYILTMGLLLAAGAIGVIVRRKWGFILLWVYLASHAALFINFQEVNPKLLVLALQTAMLFLLIYLRTSKVSS